MKHVEPDRPKTMLEAWAGFGRATSSFGHEVARSLYVPWLVARISRLLARRDHAHGPKVTTRHHDNDPRPGAIRAWNLRRRREGE
jgi:hypothetical protein